MKRLRWVKWRPLNTIDLSHPHVKNIFGVYVIRLGGSNPATVYIGQGKIRERLIYHKNDYRIQKYSEFGLYVTWASVAPPFLDGVELYFADRLQPKEGEAHPNVIPISVNLPWWPSRIPCAYPNFLPKGIVGHTHRAKEFYFGELDLWANGLFGALSLVFLMLTAFLLSFVILPDYVCQRADHYAESFFGAIIEWAELSMRKKPNKNNLTIKF